MSVQRERSVVFKDEPDEEPFSPQSEDKPLPSPRSALKKSKEPLTDKVSNSFDPFQLLSPSQIADFPASVRAGPGSQLFQRVVTADARRVFMVLEGTAGWVEGIRHPDVWEVNWNTEDQRYIYLNTDSGVSVSSLPAEPSSPGPRPPPSDGGSPPPPPSETEKVDDDSFIPIDRSYSMSVKFETEEFYAARLTGWVPFTVSATTTSGVSILDVAQDPSEQDLLPRTKPLCPSCSDIVRRNPKGYVVEVHRHLKPMLLSNKVKDGWLEKLTGEMGIMSSWKRRWMMATEKALHYFNEAPERSQKKSKAKGSRTFLQGTKVVVELIENPDPAVHKNCKDDVDKFHFGLHFTAPEQVWLMRVSTQAEKDSWVGFFQNIFQHLISPTPEAEDLPSWKRSIDEVLALLSQEDEYLQNVDGERQQMSEKIREMREMITKLRKNRESKRHALQEKQTAVATKLAEVQNLQEKVDDVEQAKRAVEAVVKNSQVDLDSIRDRLAIDRERSQAMENRAMEALTKSQISLEDVRRETAELRDAKDYHFSLWRKSEENFKTRPKDTPLYSFANPAVKKSSSPIVPLPSQQPSRVVPKELSVKNTPSVCWKSSQRAARRLEGAK